MTLCRVLHVNRSTYYKHLNYQPSARTLENQRIRSAILDVYGKSRKRFGAKKIRQRLSSEYGINISDGRVGRLMNGMQLPKMATVKPKYVASPSADVDCPNLLKKNFGPATPNQVWVSDITYVWTGGRFCYICAILDLFARTLIVWKTGTSPTAKFVSDTFNVAYYERGTPSGVLFHSDRGSQYTSSEFRKLMDRLDIVQSFSAKAHPFDNAVIESFFRYLKHEELNRRSFKSIDELNLSLFEYAHFYNNARPHSFNDGMTPAEKERLFFQFH